MKPEVWVPSLAALLSPLLPLLFTRLGQSRQDTGSRPGHGLAWWPAAVGSAAAAVLVWFASDLWRWPVLGACVTLTAAAYVLIAWRARHRMRLSPETERFLKQWAGREAGFPYDRDFLPDLVRVYTQNDLAGTGEPAAQSGPRRSKEPSPDLPTSFERLLSDPKIRHLAITGEAGTGKTSLLEFWNHDLRLRSPSRRDPLSRLVPLLIPARNLVGLRSVAEAFGPDGREALSRSPGPGMAWLVMIDAFDEINDAAARAEVERIVFEAIDEVPTGDPHAMYVVTSRGLTEDRRRSFDTRGVSEYQLQPFTLEQLREFLVREETSARDIAGRNAAYEAAVAKVDRFMDRWEGHDELLELIRLPLLARVTATIYFTDPELDVPARRIDIYHDAVEHWISQFHKRMRGDEDRYAPALRMLREWHAAEGGTDPADGDLDGADAAVRELLRRLAVSSIESGRGSVVAIARELLGIPLLPKDPARTQALLTLLDATGLVHDVKAIDPRFLHKSYAEYLAAPDLSDHGADLDAWDAALRDPDRRIGAVFALAQMEPGRRCELIDRLSADDRYALACGWIAAEGLCVEPDGGRIDEGQRERLVDVCLGGLFAQAGSAWWPLIQALASVGPARDRLIAMVEERRIGDWTLLRISRIVARQDRRGVELLRRFATENVCNGYLRTSAADDLVEHEPEEGQRLLLDFATGDGSGRIRVEALRWLAAYRPALVVRLLRKLAADAAQSPIARAEAAALLAEHAPRKGLKLAKRYVNEPTLDHQARVDLALRLTELRDPQGVALLRRFALDTAFDEETRVAAAVNLTGHDRQSGLELLRDFATNPVLADAARVHATHWLASFEGRSDLDAMLAFAADKSLDDWARLAAARWTRDEEPETGRRLLEEFASLTTFAPEARLSAIDELADFDQPRARAMLLESADDSGTEDAVRVQAASWIADRHRGIGVPLLARLAEDPSLDDGARVEANRALINFGALAALQPLRRLSDTPDADGEARVAAASIQTLFDRRGGSATLRRLAADPRLSDRDRIGALAAWVRHDGRADPGRLREAAENQRLDGAARVRAAHQLIGVRRTESLRLLKALNADESLSDDERFDALRRLVDHEPDPAISLMHGTAVNQDVAEPARYRALRALTMYRPETGLPLLRKFATDRSLPESTAPSAAYWLALRDEEAGVPLLQACAQDRLDDQQSRVDAAEHLMEFDRAASLRLLQAFADDPDFEDHARLNALVYLARHDRASGLRRIRELAETPRQPTLLTAMAAEELARYDRERGRELLSSIASDRGLPGMVRVYAAGGLARYDRPGGVRVLRRLTEEPSLGEAAALVAAQALVDFDRPAGLALLWETAADTASGGLFRIAAAGMLSSADEWEGTGRYRAFAADLSLDGISRTSAAWILSYSYKREGMESLASIRSDPHTSDTVRCWVDIALADRDPSLREALATAYAGLPSDGVALLRRSAATLTDLSPRFGYRAAARVAAIARARERRPGLLDPDGALEA
jgi:hypothetical protein